MHSVTRYNTFLDLDILLQFIIFFGFLLAIIRYPAEVHWDKTLYSSSELDMIWCEVMCMSLWGSIFPSLFLASPWYWSNGSCSDVSPGQFHTILHSHQATYTQYYTLTSSLTHNITPSQGHLHIHLHSHKVTYTQSDIVFRSLIHNITLSPGHLRTILHSHQVT